MAKKQLSPKEYEQLGRLIKNVIENGYIDRTRLIKISLLKGIATSVGAVIGATIVVSIIIWILSVFSNIRIIGPVIEDVKTNVESYK